MNKWHFAHKSHMKFVALLLVIVPVTSSLADAAGDKKRAQLLTVKRIAVAPVFFGTDTLGELPPSKPRAPTEKQRENKPELNQKQRAELAEYLDALRKLEGNAREKLPERAGARMPFEVVKADEVDSALKILKITPPELFQSAGRLNNRKFDLPEADQVKRLASQVHADAVLLGVLDEPRKSNGGYFFDPLSGPGYDSPKVHDKATFDLVLADGTLVLRQTIDVIHPLTRIGTRRFVLADWLETDDQIIEDLMDEITRYTPKRQPGPNQ